VKGTKLWQAAGSPIIQGRSRRQRPSWQLWLPAWLVSAAFVAGLVILAPAVSGGFPWAAAWGIVGGLFGALAGVEVTRAMGWRFPLLWGAVIGIGGATALLALSAALLS